MSDALDVIVVLGGGLKKDANGWRTTNFDEGDNFGIQGDRLRVVAAGFLTRENPKVILVASGGLGQLRNVVGAPTIAKVLKKELVALGISPERIIEEDNSNNTYQQLRELDKLAFQLNLERIAVISNKHHLPRVKAMVEYGPRLDSLKERLAKGTLSLVSAEQILLDHDREQWQKLIENAYKTQEMQKRLALEKQGIEQIKSGTYKFVE